MPQATYEFLDLERKTAKSTFPNGAALKLIHKAFQDNVAHYFMHYSQLKRCMCLFWCTMSFQEAPKEGCFCNHLLALSRSGFLVLTNCQKVVSRAIAVVLSLIYCFAAEIRKSTQTRNCRMATLPALAI